jgi:hypothetical protein
VSNRRAQASAMPSTSLRPIGMPRAIEVRAGDDGDPVEVVRGDARGHFGSATPVVHVEEVWRLAEAWWRESSQARTYYRVILEGGRRLTVYRDDATGAWSEQPYTEPRAQ